MENDNSCAADDALMGHAFVRHPQENGYHRGEFVRTGESLQWKNDAGLTWEVLPIHAKGLVVRLETGDDCPYGKKEFVVVRDRKQQVKAVRFLGEEYALAGPTKKNSAVVAAEAEIHDDYGMDVSEFLGAEFVREPCENNYHTGRLEKSHRKDTLVWVNRAKVKWTLEVLRDDQGRIDGLLTGSDCPYNKHKDERLKLYPLWNECGDLVGLDIMGEVYHHNTNCACVGSARRKTCKESDGGLHGYVSVRLKTDEDFHMGYSSYTTIWKLRGELPALQRMQIGLPGCWLIPDNRDFTGELCPPGTRAHAWKERGPVYRDVFQTIEGGPGFWCSTRFPCNLPKYRCNGTPNGYNHEISSPLFGFGQTKGLKPEELGLIQISNRLLIPPDGITFEQFKGGRKIGNAWMALPLLEPYTMKDGTPVGKNTWTLFLSTVSFNGPVAGFCPDIWARLSQAHKAIRGRGLDARQALNSAVAMEVNTVPYFEDTDDDGDAVFRVPQLAFPNDKSGSSTSTLVTHLRSYSSDAAWETFQSWVQKENQGFSFKEKGTKVMTGTAGPFSLGVGPKESRVQQDMSAIVSPSSGPTKDGFKLHWGAGESNKLYRQLPALYKRHDKKANAMETSKCSPVLRDACFQAARATKHSKAVYKSDVVVQGGSKERQTKELSDGSVVSFQWVRFVDQPTFAMREWSSTSEKEDLQKTIERLHKEWSVSGSYLKPPSDADDPGFELAKLDSAILVHPPKGMEVGYVPIAVRQSYNKPKQPGR